MSCELPKISGPDGSVLLELAEVARLAGTLKSKQRSRSADRITRRERRQLPGLRSHCLRFVKVFPAPTRHHPRRYYRLAQNQRRFELP